MGSVIMFRSLAVPRPRGEDLSQCVMESPELAALYCQKAEEARSQAKLMHNASVRSAMEGLASIWERMAERELVGLVIDDFFRNAEQGLERRMSDEARRPMSHVNIRFRAG